MSGAQIHAYLRAARGTTELERVGPFVARFTPGRDHPMLNYAVPDDDVRPSTGEIEALVRAFRRRGLKPRLEYADDAAPGLDRLLVAAGFEVEARLPLMGCRPDAARPVDQPAEFVVEIAETDADHADAIVVADEAYGEPASAPGPGAIAARRAMAAAGGVVVLARERATGTPVGSGLFPPPRAGVSELAAVGTRPAFRRRGVASTITSRLIQAAIDRGVELLWLTPEHEYAERIYRRAGFVRLGGQMIHLSAAIVP